jgi:hypothetical protein
LAASKNTVKRRREIVKEDIRDKKNEENGLQGGAKIKMHTKEELEKSTMF